MALLDRRRLENVDVQTGIVVYATQQSNPLSFVGDRVALAFDPILKPESIYDLDRLGLPLKMIMC